MKPLIWYLPPLLMDIYNPHLKRPQPPTRTGYQWYSNGIVHAGPSPL